MGLFDKFSGGPSTATEPPAPVGGPPRVATAEVSVRLAFIRKVYTLLTINFAITIGVSILFTTVDAISDYVTQRRGLWVMLAAFVVAIAFLLVLSCFKPGYPLNLILMYAFVLAFSVFVGVTVARYYANGAGPIVIQSLIATAAVFLSITFYVAITKKDFSFLYGFLSAGLIVLIVLVLSTFVIRWFTPSGKLERWVYFVISVFGYVCLFSLFVVSCSVRLCFSTLIFFFFFPLPVQY